MEESKTKRGVREDEARSWIVKSWSSLKGTTPKAGCRVEIEESGFLISSISVKIEGRRLSNSRPSPPAVVLMKVSC